MKRNAIILTGATTIFILGLFTGMLLSSTMSAEPSCTDTVDGKFRHYTINCILESGIHDIAVGCRWDMSNNEDSNCTLPDLSAAMNVTGNPASSLSFNNISIERGVYLSSSNLLNGFDEQADKVDIILHLNETPTHYVYSELMKRQKKVEEEYGA